MIENDDPNALVQRSFLLKLLSVGGKEILIKTVLQAIPVYAMSVFLLPKHLCKTLNGIIGRFWWRKKMEAKTIHWINSYNLCKGKKDGGMGFRDFELFNMALLAKQAWRLLNQPATLVSRIMKARYFPQYSIIHASRRPNSSFAWQSIYEGMKYLKQGLSFPNGNDSPSWVGDSSGVFTVKSGYNLFLSIKQMSVLHKGEASDPSSVSSFWSRMWKLNLPSKIKKFTWKIYHNAIPCAENLARRGCLVDLKCPSCGARVETSLHVFRDCWCARSLLTKLEINEATLSIDCKDPGYWLWICAKLCSKEQFRQLLCGLWFLWFRRNSILHGSDEIGIDSLYAKMKFFLSHFASKPDLNMVGYCSLVAEEDCINFCCDGSWSPAVRDGGWGFAATANGLIIAVGAGWKEGISSCHIMEGHALVESFKFAADHQWNKAIFTVDSALVYRAVVLGQCPELFNHSWLLTCWKFLELFPNWSLLIVSRDEIPMADPLARKAREEHWSWKCTEAIPSFISLS